MTKSKVAHSQLAWIGLAAFVLAGAAYLLAFSSLGAAAYSRAEAIVSQNIPAPVPELNKAGYDARMLALAHIDSSETTADSSIAASTTLKLILPGSASSSVSVPGSLWPHRAVYPEAGALLPFNRIVAYYGNFYSTGMGVLGEYPEGQVLQMLASTSEAWALADPTTPVIPAIDYIAVTAQGSPGKDKKYRLEMPDSQIDHALEMANKMHGIVILDVQVGESTLQAELPTLTKYLSMPNVHLAIDPEFSMKHGIRPGLEIGTFDATDINYAANFLAKLVQENNLPPKILIVHRFTEEMVTNAKQITPLPQVQVVMDMDGWGFPAKKINTYQSVIAPEPVQFTGFKLFYKNDVRPPSTGMLTPEQVLRLTPSPIFIQYQ